MPHYEAYESFQTKKSKQKKAKAKAKALGKQITETNDFIVDYGCNPAIVIEVRYDDAYVFYNDEIVVAKLRKDINMVCNQVVFPGDKVVIQKNEENFVIQNLIKRKSLLSRVKKDRTRLDDVGLNKNIAANIELAVIVVAAKEPPLHPKFIDRYLMILKNNEIDAVICLNKCDLKTDEDEILDVYREIGIPVIETSTLNNIGIEELKSKIDGKQAIFVGNSGVGKSSLINKIMDSEEIKTSHVSEKSKRGRHTTTTSKYYIWNDNSSIIDTPGIRSLDVSSFEAVEVQNFFPDIEKWNTGCKYRGCLHYNIPTDDCSVKQAVKSKLINYQRYESYLKIVSSIVDDGKLEDVLAEFDDVNIKKRELK